MSCESLDHDTYSNNRLALNEIAMNNRSLYRPRVVKVNFFSALRVMITFFSCFVYVVTCRRYGYAVIQRQLLNCVHKLTIEFERLMLLMRFANWSLTEFRDSDEILTWVEFAAHPWLGCCRVALTKDVGAHSLSQKAPIHLNHHHLCFSCSLTFCWIVYHRN